MLRASSDQDLEKVIGLPTGTGVRAKISKMRNYQFHKKFFALLQIGYEAFDPPKIFHKGVEIQKSQERFRKDCIIMAGYYDTVVNLKGEVRAEAKSISFGNMSQDEFEKLYNAVCNVLLQRVLTNYTKSDLDEVVEKIINF